MLLRLLRVTVAKIDDFNPVYSLSKYPCRRKEQVYIVKWQTMMTTQAQIPTDVCYNFIERSGCQPWDVTILYVCVCICVKFPIVHWYGNRIIPQRD